MNAKPSATRDDKRQNGKSSPVQRKAAGRLSANVGSDACRRAAVILEVLAGERTAQQGAEVLKISIQQYYLLERKALGGLAAACQGQSREKRPSQMEKELASLEREVARCRRECLRQAALVRATQRAVGLPASTSHGGASTKGKKKQARGRRKSRALRAADALRKNSTGLTRPTELEPSSPAGSTDHPSQVTDKERQDDA
jgi:hypothetical protein